MNSIQKNLTQSKNDTLTQQDLISKMPTLLSGNEAEKRQEIKAYFNQTSDTYEALFTTLASEESYLKRPCSLRHPLIFYYGHTATFFVNKLHLAKLLPIRIDSKIESMCAIGVDEMSWDDLNEQHYEWPSVDDITRYRQKVRKAVNKLIDKINIEFPINTKSDIWTVLMGIEHERIHIETSSVLIRQLPIEDVIPQSLFPVCPDYSDTAPTNSLQAVPAGHVEINHQEPSKTYGWDNEYGHHFAEVGGFKASQFLVSNLEFLSFIEDNGYENNDYWDEEGNEWREFTPNKHPSFWLKKDKAWYLRCMTNEIPMPWNWPVEINQLEAQAFCRWKTKQTKKPIRLPSEDEYLRLSEHSQALKFKHNANLNLQKFASSMPIDSFKTGDFYDVIGNVWQWSQTPIYPFEGFKVHPIYDDFTMPTFDNQHAMIKGGSWISTGNEINGHSRYAFRKHFYQHAGFRYIESNDEVQTIFSTYETDASVAQYCEFHYGTEYFKVQNFAQHYAHKAIEFAKNDIDLQKTKKNNNLKVLEVGSSVGRACFELANHFDEVVGLDFSARFIRVANQLQTQGTIHYSIPTEGEIMDFKSQSLQDLNLQNTVSNCKFMQQDASNMKPHFTGYDMVVAINLIDRLSDPKKFLSTIHERMNSKGLLLIGSPYTWLEEFTNKDNWIGGYKNVNTGENITTLEGLHELLASKFELVKQPFDMEFVIRETHRKYQHSLSEMSLWKLKD